MLKQKLLVIDNQPALSNMLRDSFGYCFEIKTAGSRQDGLTAAKKELPELIIIGFIEPRGDAFRLHQDLREDRMTCLIPLLIVDVTPEEQSGKGWRRSEGMQMDAEGYMARPVDPERLYEEIEKCMTNACLQSYEMKKTLEQMETALSAQMEEMPVL